MLTPKKSLGQNFLKNKRTARKIVESINPAPDDIILEIGPGTGVLTQFLIESEAQVYAVDIDKRMTTFLSEKYKKWPNLHVINRDILELEIPTAQLEKRLKIIGNLPYHLTSPILAWLCSNCHKVEMAVLTVQKEVAERIVAQTGSSNYSALTVFVNNFCEAKALFDLGKKQFHPPPNVASTVVRLDFYDRPLIEPSVFEQVQDMVRRMFSQRRKMVINSLSHAANIDKSRARYYLAEAEIDSDARPQNITLAQYHRLLTILKENDVIT